MAKTDQMMVKIRYSLLGVIFLMSSCDKFLEVETPDNLVKDEFWQDEGQVHSSLIGLYTSLNSCLDVFQSWGDIRSSLYAPGAGDGFNSNWAEFLRHDIRSEEHTSELQPLLRLSYAVFS